jgi:hypothetical protein
MMECWRKECSASFKEDNKRATEIPSQVSKQLSTTVSDILTACLRPINSRYAIGDEAANNQLWRGTLTRIDTLN